MGSAGQKRDTAELTELNINFIDIQVNLAAAIASKNVRCHREAAAAAYWFGR